MNLMSKHYDRVYYEGSDRNPLHLYGIAVRPGWYNLVNELADKIAEIDPEQKIKFLQIKEKFGGLRFYTDHTNFTLEKDRYLYNAETKLIAEYESKSYQICEVCGKEGKLRNEFKWMKTLCDEHAEEYRKSRE